MYTLTQARDRRGIQIRQWMNVVIEKINYTLNYGDVFIGKNMGGTDQWDILIWNVNMLNFFGDSCYRWTKYKVVCIF
jgi:hypothetical protein